MIYFLVQQFSLLLYPISFQSSFGFYFQILNFYLALFKILKKKKKKNHVPSLWFLFLLWSLICLNIVFWGLFLIVLLSQILVDGPLVCGACWLVIFFSLFTFYWSLVDLQCCVSFKCTAKWFSYTYTYSHSFSVFSHIGLSQNTKYSSLYCTAGPIVK